MIPVGSKSLQLSPVHALAPGFLLKSQLPVTQHAPARVLLMYFSVQPLYRMYSQVWLPVLLVVSMNRENMYSLLSSFAPENLVLRDRFGRPVPRQPAHVLHTQAEYSGESRDSCSFPRWRPFIYFNRQSRPGCNHFVTTLYTPSGLFV